MQNLKIRVNSADESKEAQELFFEFGGSWAGYKKIHDWPEIKQLYLSENYITFSNNIDFFMKDSNKEITLPELRAMVNPINEYLEPLPNGEYKYHSNVSLVGGEWIKIPEGAEIAILDDEKLSFAKPVNNGDDVLVLDVGHDVDWDTTKWESWDEFIDFGFDAVWQREQDEPFLTPETTLNDQYAEIEGVRQPTKDNVNHPNHYTQGKVECIDALESATIGKSGIEAVCVANVIKYLWRYEEKNGIEDVKKAQFYLNRLIATLENNNG